PLGRRGWEWNVLARACGAERQVLRAHSAPVRAVAWSRDGAGWPPPTRRARCASGTGRTEARAHAFGGGLVAAASADRVRLWDTASGTEKRSWEASADALALSADGSCLATALGDGIRLRDVATGEETARLDRRSARIRALAFSPDGRLLASVAGEPGRVGDLRLREAATGREVPFFSIQPAAMASVAWGPDGRLAAGSDAMREMPGLVWLYDGSPASGEFP
ncbi:MAG: hypothetical protein K2W96_07875, partial [Gemmataceae bacterium]|nr:hypothetical protein [Gemmataceae bacterium]